MRRSLAVFVLLALCLTGCAPAAPPSPALSADLYQPRSDIAKGRIAVSVTNGSDRTVTITGVRLVSADYPGEPAWDGRAVDLQPGKGSPDLRIALPDAVCGEQSASAAIEVDWRDTASSGTTTVTPGDRFSFLASVTRARVFTAAVDGVATLEAADFAGGGPGTPPTWSWPSARAAETDRSRSTPSRARRCWRRGTARAGPRRWRSRASCGGTMPRARCACPSSPTAAMRTRSPKTRSARSSRSPSPRRRPDGNGAPDGLRRPAPQDVRLLRGVTAASDTISRGPSR